MTCGCEEAEPDPAFGEKPEKGGQKDAYPKAEEPFCPLEHSPTRFDVCQRSFSLVEVQSAVVEPVSRMDRWLWGWDASLEREWDRQRGPGLQPGRVAIVERSRCLVVGVGSEGRDEGGAWASLSGRLLHTACEVDLPVVGDWVAIRNEGTSVQIVRVLPRRSFLQRKIVGRQSRSQGICANLDTVFLVSAVGQELNPRRIERFLAAIWESGASPVVIVNKIDTAKEPEVLRQSLTGSVLGVPILLASATTPGGVSELESYLLPGRTVALIGSSGVGKSSILNALVGESLQKTTSVREKDERGRHTTTRREMILLPSGGILIDTPGMREFGLVDAKGVLQVAFSDVEGLAKSCRFSDCRHQGEPGCAIQEAAASGEIEEERLANFHKLQREAAYQERRAEERLAALSRPLKNEKGGVTVKRKALKTGEKGGLGWKKSGHISERKLNKDLGLKSL